MDIKKISTLQLFYVIVSFQIGNTSVYGLGGGAKQYAWLVIVLAMLCGFIWMFVYIKLSSYYPDDTLLQMIPKINDKFLSYPIILIFIVYFTYLASRACRDFADLIATTILVETPMNFCGLRGDFPPLFYTMILSSKIAFCQLILLLLLSN
ncbi:hypothetical protein WQ54_01120 [Bacillus sp. SA1-12]|uniref:GerAB/ArcD/ProY family transporter n=1 Tax=Bacillus sp. SA1-12 TaxID=1455638 RepID=UPI000626CB1C|nr:GerAB/ArcD/ProY family transporter [Bacillus sp. SA1-12]KKI94168.1 hypothetical protein WQ54_01120 [Bacillus sp. SA1-12]